MITRALLILVVVLGDRARLLAVHRGRGERRHATSTGAPGGRGSRSGGMQTGVKMLPCPVCGTYVVPGKAIMLAGGSGPVYFCSDKCRDAYVPR